MKKRFEELKQKNNVIAILRGVTPDEIVGVCDALAEGGITLLEIPLNSPNPLESIARAAKHCGERQMVGAGTVLTPEEVRNVAEAGGSFVISPNTDAAVIRETKRLGLISIPGFFTATEGFAAVQAGADYLKLFPAVLGPEYIKDLKTVIKTPILAVGSVNLENARDFLNVCEGIVVGRALYKPGKPLDEIAKDARLFTEAVREIADR